ncbi:MAG: hypothetical protein KY397_06155, partial [Gemmatimonadetes bacterium]|nr:hypothetical protein [Gemmatimonadota bacterium]
MTDSAEAASRPAAPPTVSELLAEAERRLEAKDVEFPDASALWLLAKVLDALEDPDALEEEPDRPVPPEAARRFWSLVERRERHEPYGYLVGVSDFRGRLMEVEHGVFLPRLQSERMCDELEAWVREDLSLDAGTSVGISEKPGTDPRCSPVVTEVAVTSPDGDHYSFHIEHPLAEL